MEKLLLLGLNTATSLDPGLQTVHIRKNTSNSITLSADSPQGCVLSPLLFILLTHDRTSRYKGNKIIKFMDDITVVGLICGNEESM